MKLDSSIAILARLWTLTGFWVADKVVLQQDVFSQAMWGWISKFKHISKMTNFWLILTRYNQGLKSQCEYVVALTNIGNASSECFKIWILDYWCLKLLNF